MVAEAAETLSTAFRDLDTDPSISIETIEPNLQAFYAKTILPELTSALYDGEATYGGYGPKAKPAKYLQNTYTATNPHQWPNRSKFINPEGQTNYDRAHANFHDELKFIVEEFEYYDMFLIDHQSGDIIYSVRKEADFATNIYNGPYRSSYLGEVVDKVKGDPSQGAVYMSDVEFYLPSKNRPAFFVASGIYEDDTLKGILAIQLTLNDIDAIMTSNGKWAEVGLKESGETYIVGADYLMRNNSRFAAEDFDNYLAQIRNENVSEKTINQIRRYKSSILIQRVKTLAVEQGLAGKTETRVIEDYRGIPVLSAYAPLSIKEHDFVVLAEMDAAEAFKPVRKLMMNTAITTAIVIPLSALLGIWLSGLLMRPARVMEEKAEQFLDGDEDIRFQDNKNDEWGQLGRKLNAVLEMAKGRLNEAETSRTEIREITQRLMPGAIGERYLRGEERIISHEKNASAVVMIFSHSAQLNDLSNPRGARNLYEILDDQLDELAGNEGVDVLNQAGLCYVGFCGLTAPMKNHAERLFRFVLKARMLIDAFNAEHGTDLNLHMGFDSGPLFGALIGNYSMAYEIWGDVVNRGFDMAYSSPAGTLTISDRAIEQIGSKSKTNSVKVNSLSGEIIHAKRIEKFPTLDAF